MPPSAPRLRVLSVGGNAVSAFLSWRLQATNACDVTLVWKANYQSVAQYGISFKSKLFGNERFKPRHVVQSPEDAAGRESAYDYVLLCVKALPDVYNLADIIQSVVTPQHTCILVNTTNTLGVERQLEERFPTNVVLSLVSAAGLQQLGASEFEHSGSTEIWVGPANLESRIPQSIQRDMSEALSMTLTTGQVDCKVSDNIRQQQFERMIGPIAFHPASVVFETPVIADLLQKPGVRELISDVIEELIQIAIVNKCSFEPGFKDKIIDSMAQIPDVSTMYEDFAARRPMEVETYLGSPSKLAKAAGVNTPRIDTLYTILRHINIVNKDKPLPQATPEAGVNGSAPSSQPHPMNRMHSHPPTRPMNGPMNGNGRPFPPRGPPNGMAMPPPGRRGPWPANGSRGPVNGFPPRGASSVARKPSFEGDNLDEFSHVVLYDDMPDGDIASMYGESGGASSSQNIRERELMLRERELAIRQQELALRGRGGRRGSHAKHHDFDDDDDDDEFFDPGYGHGRGPTMPPVDPDNFDIMSITSRRTKRTPSQGQLRKDLYSAGNGMRPGGYGRPPMGRHRTSAQLMSDMPTVGENILNNPMMGFSSNRYGTVDRKEMADESRTNSLTASRLHDMGGPGGPYPPPPRRTSRSPGNPFGPGGRGPGRPAPMGDPYMPVRNGRPSPPGAIPAPIAKYPPGQGMMVPPAQPIEQSIDMSKPFAHKAVTTKSLTGSASASAGSGDSGSANIESEPSAHSSTSSFAPRTMIHA